MTGPAAQDRSIDRMRLATSPRNVLLILGGIWIGLFLYAILIQLSGYLTIHGFRANFFPTLFLLTVKVWLPWVVVSPLVVFLARRFPIHPDSWVRGIAIHLLLLLLLALLTSAALSFHYHYLEAMREEMKSYLPWQHIGHFLFGDSFFLYDAIIYTVFVAAFNIQNFYAQAVQRQRDSIQLTAKLNEARLEALKMQVNPHFLFNTLNGISVLVMKGENDRAEEMIRKLSDFFRMTLADSGKHWVPLAEELENVGKYLAIEQLRFRDRLKLAEDFQPEALSALVPTMILQPLVENAMVHGLADLDQGGTIALRCRVDGARLVLTVEDDGAGCDFASVEEGVGLSNVRERLHQSYGEDHSVTVKGQPGRGVRIELQVPFRKGGEA